MLSRLCGREQEYGMAIKPTRIFSKFKSILHPASEEGMLMLDEFQIWRRGFAEAIIRQIVNSGRPNFSFASNRIWLGNGSLVYIDLSCILEFATAEGRSCSLEGVLQEKSSELILNEALGKAAAEKGVNLISLYKNNVGPASSGDIYDECSYASHHNYSYASLKQFSVYTLLENFIPVSLIFSGNGHIFRQGSNIFFYVLSPRAPHIRLRKSNYTLTNRAVINLRDESLMDKSSGLSRFHLISRDATRCEFQTWLVDGMTHLVIRLAEEGWELPPKFYLTDSVAELHNINFALDENLNYKVGCWFLPGFYKVDLLEYNRIFLAAAKQLNPLSPEEKKVLQEWERVLELLKARAFDKLVGELDWATKWFLLKNQMKREGYELNDIRAWLLEMKYHNISSDPKQSAFAWLDEKGYIKHLVTKEAIQAAARVPPETRAKSRGRLVELAAKNPKLYYKIKCLDWDSVQFQDRQSPVYFGDKDNPLIAESAELEKLYQDLELNLD